MTSTGARLRQTFKYPTDSESSDASREELDEEEQENLISTLHNQNAQQNALYTLVFTILPLFLILPFIFTFRFSPLLSILGVTSLLISTGRIRFSSPSSSPSPTPPPPRQANQAATSGILNWLQITDFEHRLLDAVPENGPLRMALPWLNGAICVVLGLAAMVLYRRRGRSSGSGRVEAEADGMWIFCLLPSIAWAMVEVALRSMEDVGKGVGELERLRYRYKGA
ncbi:hypothetical protein EPUS_02468 [Endocarpon pusillum Z07020]|uniref:Uncharacterized protein n=1 Tax=Endocarpon pusillum (strain Z07020 / HMAS-L-300199) TaxID=1263415 RepID=U1G075_ENDPU|nr:uncharacterized protein EPUS_02468 [Endocarpon pusillum Z07020]ERF70602.1 hypothetical protein EPUS_02468 [Endocarpon pusillum Z07020]